MSLGLGILLSVLAIIIAWQIDKRGAWRKFGKFSLWVVAGLVLAGGAFGVWLWWEKGKYAREQEALLQQVRRADIAEFWDIKLGASQNEVVYLKGNPKERNEAKDGDAYWKYDDGEANYYVYWDEDGKVDFLACANSALCPQFAGIGVESSEKRIIEKLGSPSKETAPDEDGTKTIEYGGDANFLEYILVKGKAVVVLFGKRGAKKSDANKAEERS